jgi:hypothetical protein
VFKRLKEVGLGRFRLGNLSIIFPPLHHPFNSLLQNYIFCYVMTKQLKLLFLTD